MGDRLSEWLSGQLSEEMVGEKNLGHDWIKPRAIHDRAGRTGGVSVWSVGGEGGLAWVWEDGVQGSWRWGWDRMISL